MRRMHPTAESTMELTRTITHLAAANQQLAEAHNLTLNHLRWLLADKRRAHSRTRDVRSKTGKARVLLTKQNPSNRRLRRPKGLTDDSKTVDDQEIVGELRREIAELNTFKQESLMENDRLTSDLGEQRLLVERLRQDFENSLRECERKEESLKEVSQELNRSKHEEARLCAELDVSRRKGNSRLEESETLKRRLAELEQENGKHVQALEEASQQIRALELAIQSTKTNVEASSAAASSSVEEFKKELTLKREARQRALAAISAEMDRLRRELEAEKAAHAETAKLLEEARGKTDEKETSDCTWLEALRLKDLLKISDEITSDLLVQLERTDDLRFQLESSPGEHSARIQQLKHLAEETRAVLRGRKRQVDLLKDRLAQILARLTDRRQPLDSDEIREELERQLEDMARSRSLGDERSRILLELREHSRRSLHELRFQLDSVLKDKQSLQEDLSKSEGKMDAQDADILSLESQLGLAKADCRELENQMSLINSLFTQMLLSASSAEMDLDRLTQLLQENHDLISDVAKEKGTEAAALPKLLLEIIEQVDGRAGENQDKKEEEDLQEESIANNLPKVWRVLLELLSCHAASSRTASSAASAESAPDSCYKSVDTPTGPRLVISVSKTYIRLKELILEKKHLEKETNRMKQLNAHLECKLSEQEKRLSTVSDELTKTWSIVGRMEVQHQQLHTHEKILRYELQQKRKMLQELKQELEYCREKWESARQKNNKTEIEWRSLRREFAARKALATHTDSFNMSGESGFSDEREEDSDEDEENIGKRIRPINSRKRSRKEESRAKTPDTESEQATDNELSESKTSGPRTPTPETEPELESSPIVEQGCSKITSTADESEPFNEESMNPFDKALTNVIENLIDKDEAKCEKVPKLSSEEVSKDNIMCNKNLDEISVIDPSESKPTTSPCNDIVSPIYSVFTIGPVPDEILAAKNVQFGNPYEVNKTTENSNATISEEKKTSLFSTDSVEQSAASTSSTPSATCSTKTASEVKAFEDTNTTSRPSNLSSSDALDARSARLRHLEEQAEWLIKKMNNTNQRGSALSTRLEALHETFGSIPAPPPMPDVLPAFRLRCEIHDKSLHGAKEETPGDQNNDRDRDNAPL